MVEHEPALVRLDRGRAGADLRRLPRERHGRHDVAVAAPVHEVGALRVEDVAERRVAVVARPAQHRVALADPAREEHAVAVEREERVVELVERLEVVRVRDADRRAVVAVAPRHVVAVLEPGDARVVGVQERAPGSRATRPSCGTKAIGSWSISHVDPVGAAARVDVHRAARVVDAEHAGEAVAERDDGGVEDAVRARDRVAGDDRVAARAPEDVVVPAGRSSQGSPARARSARRSAPSGSCGASVAVERGEVAALDLDERAAARPCVRAVAGRWRPSSRRRPATSCGAAVRRRAASSCRGGPGCRRRAPSGPARRRSRAGGSSSCR